MRALPTPSYQYKGPLCRRRGNPSDAGRSAQKELFRLCGSGWAEPLITPARSAIRQPTDCRRADFTDRITEHYYFSFIRAIRVIRGKILIFIRG